MHNRFITFEGIDGSGKSSQIPFVVEQLRAAGAEVVCTREPGGTVLGEKLRAMLLNEVMDIDAELLLMFAARRQHLSEVIEPALAAGKWVVSDRFADSSFAFQGGGRGVAIERIRVLDAWCGGVRPGTTFLFDLPVEVARGRMEGRVLDRFELEGRAFDERVRAVYLQIAQEESRRIRVIDADRTVEAIQQELGKVVSERFAKLDDTFLRAVEGAR